MKESFNNNIKINDISSKIVDAFISKELAFPYKSYAEYIINIDISIKSYKIKRRYSDFERFHSKLKEKVDNLPSIPVKRFFSVSKSTISERKSLLETYLNAIIQNLNLYKHQKVLDFIELDKEVLVLIKRSNSGIKITNEDKTDNLKVSKSFKDRHQIKEDHYIFESSKNRKQSSETVDSFLENLEKDNDSNYVDSYLRRIDIDLSSLERDDILKLYLGDGNELKGLFFHGGNMKVNSLYAESCVNLLSNLLCFEYNPDSDKYINCLRMANLKHLNQLKLNEHLKKNNNIANCCFLIIDKYINETVNINNLLEDDITINKYLNWKNMNERY